MHSCNDALVPPRHANAWFPFPLVPWAATGSVLDACLQSITEGEKWIGLCCVGLGGKKYLNSIFGWKLNDIYHVIPRVFNFSIYLGMPKIWAGACWPAIIRTFGFLGTATTASADNFCSSHLRWYTVLYTNREYANDLIMDPEKSKSIKLYLEYLYLKMRILKYTNLYFRLPLWRFSLANPAV
jgi:hypothetical protein